MLVREPKGSLSFSCGSTWARLNPGRSKRSGMRAIEIAGLRFCFAAESEVVVRITGICLTEERSRRADKDYLAFVWFIVDREVTLMETHENPRARLRDLPLQGDS